MKIPNGAHPAPDEPMDPAEVLARAKAFAPTPAEQFVSWATGVGECLVIPGCSCNGCATVAHEVKAAKVMRLALEMIVRKADDADAEIARKQAARLSLTAREMFKFEGLNNAARTAKQALRECQ